MSRHNLLQFVRNDLVEEGLVVNVHRSKGSKCVYGTSGGLCVTTKICREPFRTRKGGEKIAHKPGNDERKTAKRFPHISLHNLLQVLASSFTLSFTISLISSPLFSLAITTGSRFRRTTGLFTMRDDRLIISITMLIAS